MYLVYNPGDQNRFDVVAIVEGVHHPTQHNNELQKAMSEHVMLLLIWKCTDLSIGNSRRSMAHHPTQHNIELQKAMSEHVVML